MNIAQSLERSTRLFPDKPAIVFGDRTITYRELSASVDRTAHGLVEMGVAPGDRIALILPNIPEFAIAYMAALKVGAIAVSINPTLIADEIDYLLADSGAELIFTTASLMSQMEQLPEGSNLANRLIICDGEIPGLRALDELGAGVTGPFAARDLDPNDPAAILYTSGTTGKQKGVVLSHQNVLSNTAATSRLLSIGPDDRLLLFLPLFHCFGQNFVMNTALRSGATLILQRGFEPKACLDAVARDGVSMFFGVPTIYICLLNAHVIPEQLVGVRLFFSAAATMPVEVARAWHATFGRVIHEGYGLTETSPFASFNHVSTYRPGSVGASIPGVEMKVVDANDHEVPRGVWGEIVIKGPNVMVGYWQRPEETAFAQRGGWFHTGDIGYVDDDGYFYVVDRIKDMINIAGMKVWPREVEEVLYKHPAVKECAVVGCPDPLRGEVPGAYVVAPADSVLTSAEVTAHCRRHLAPFKVPRSVTFVDSLPKSATGKILKRVLRDEAVKQHA